MPRSSKTTYAEALKHISPADARISKLDKILGGCLLAAAPFTAAASLTLIDPKTEFISLLREVTGVAAGRIKGAAGKSHFELLEASHTLIGLTAFFETLAVVIGPTYASLEVTDLEKSRLASSASTDGNAQPEWGEATFPMPSAIRGFHETLSAIEAQYRLLFDATCSFFSGLAAWESISHPPIEELKSETVRRSLERYRDLVTRFAVDVPEFGFWRDQDEHAATRNALISEFEEARGEIREQTDTLQEMQTMLRSIVETPDAISDVEDKLAQRASLILDRPIWRSETESLAFPIVSEGFVSPDFRFGVMRKGAEPGDENWWVEAEQQADLAAFMARYLADPESTRRSLIILGHPGAGKTLLTEVVASRVPPEAYTTVLVKLKSVDANAELHRQLESAIETAVRESVSWGRLCRESSKTKVLIFDGLDELIQATGVTQSDFIEKVADFQEMEWRSGHAVIPIVTSRLLVMDRVRVPLSSVIVRLESFTDEQISKWVSIWNFTNRRSAGFRPIEPEEMMHHDLARQPLLIFLLAIYSAESGSRLDSEDLSGAELYRRLLDSFIARQVRDKSNTEYSEKEQRRREVTLRRDLSIAAFAMFNRGKQFIGEGELGDDLRKLSPRAEAREVGFAEPLSRAKETVAAFFFIHVAQVDEHDDVATRRSYEFLHATFAEYLVAEYTVILLKQLAQDRERLIERHLDEGLDDRLLSSLLSHQPLLKRSPIVEFAGQCMGPATNGEIRDVAIELFRAARRRHSFDGTEGYEPTPFDAVRRVAAYTVNLATLMVVAPPSGLLLSDERLTADYWSSTVKMWEAGLDFEGRTSVFQGLSRTGDTLSLASTMPNHPASLEEAAAKLAGNLTLAARLNAGNSRAVNHTIRSDEMLNLVRRFNILNASRWLIPQIGRLTPYDEKAYQDIYREASDHPDAVNPGLAESILLILVDDGPFLDSGLVSSLVSIALPKARNTIPPHVLSSLAFQCPYLLGQDDFKSAVLKGDATLLSDFALRVAARRSQEVHSAIDLTTAVATARIKSVVHTTTVAPEMVAEYADAEWLSTHLASDILTSLGAFGGLAWHRIDPGDMQRFLTGLPEITDSARAAIDSYVESCKQGDRSKLESLTAFEEWWREAGPDISSALSRDGIMFDFGEFPPLA
jgi:hypothetical protein